MEGCADKEDHSRFPVHFEGDPDPAKSSTELEQDQCHVDKSQD